jgi:hypothetical protein
MSVRNVSELLIPHFAIMVESGNQGDGRERWSQILLRRRAVLRECDREIEIGTVRLTTTRSCGGAIVRDRESQNNHGKEPTFPHSSQWWTR